MISFMRIHVAENEELSSYQYKVLRLIFYISIPLIAFFSALNLLHDHLILGLAEILLDLCFLLCLLLFLNNTHIEKIKQFLLISSFVILSLLFIDGGIDNSGLYWSMIFPMLCYPLFGCRTARVQILILAGFLLLLTLLHFIVQPFLTYSPISLLMAGVMYFFLASMAHIFESHRESENRRMQVSNQQLEATRTELERARDHLEQEVVQRTTSLRQTAERLAEEIREKEKIHQAWRQTQQQFIQAQKMEAMGTMVSRLAHDFNNILAAMMGCVYLLEKDDDETKRRSRLRLMHDELERASTVINRLKLFTHPDSGTMETFSVRKFLQDVVELARLTMDEQIRFDVNIDIPNEAWLHGDNARLRQVVINIINNACQAVSECAKPRICLQASVVSGEQLASPEEITHPPVQHALELQIEDNGCGIDKTHIHRIFDPFFTTKQAGEGTGLGLSMTHATMNSHGGYINVDSQAGQGTCFRIYLPLLEESQSVTNDTPACETNVDATANTIECGEGQCVLLVDDDPFLLQTHGELLQSIGYRVLLAGSGQQAIELMQTQGDDVALILCDIVMPGLSGPETLLRLNALGIHRPVLFITGYDLHQQMEILPADAHYHVLKKPLQVPQLSREIKQQLHAEIRHSG